MSFTSYAQNFEDVMLWRALKNVENGFYIDVGAQDPTIDSVSLAFHEKGWQGIHVEPTPYYAELLRQQRPNDIIIQAAIGSEPALAQFFVIPKTGISTADSEIATQQRERGFDVQEVWVNFVTLSSVFSACAGKEIHWLKIDVEGFERQVLSSWKTSEKRPWIVVVESTLPLTQIENHETWEPIILAYGYTPVYFDGLNRYYISDDHPELRSAFTSPPNVFDGFSLNGTASAPYHQRIEARYQEIVNDTKRQHDQQSAICNEEIKRLQLVVANLDNNNKTQDTNHKKREQSLYDKFTLEKKEITKSLSTRLQKEQEIVAQLLLSQQKNEQEKYFLLQHADRAKKEIFEQLHHAQNELRFLSKSYIDRESEINSQLSNWHDQHTALFLQEVTRLHNEVHRLFKEKINIENTLSESRYQIQQHLKKEAEFINDIEILKSKIVNLSDGNILKNELISKIRSKSDECEKNLKLRNEIEVELIKFSEVDKNHIIRLEKAIDELRKNLEEIKQSWSWRLSSPLRKISKLTKSRTSHIKKSNQGNRIPEHLHEKIKNNTPPELKFNCIDSGQNIMLRHSSVTSEINIEKLLSLPDIQFIEKAYLTILKRPPDDEGFNYYTERLLAGAHKVKILEQFLNSPEAYNTGEDISSLKRSVRSYKLRQLPIVGKLSKYLFGENAEFLNSAAKINRASALKSMAERETENSRSNRDNDQQKSVFSKSVAPLELDHSLKAILSNPTSKVFWAGSQPPFSWMNASTRIYSPKHDYRLPASFHQSFDLVYLTERDLGHIKAWPLVIDEALRLLAPHGTLLIQYTNTPLLTNFEMKNIIAARGNIKIHFEHTFENNGPCLFAVKNTKTERRITELSGFSFGVITDGKRPELLRTFIESAQSIDNKNNAQIEVLVCGPKEIQQELEAQYKNIIFIVQPDDFQSLGWITKKKNLIVQAANYENLIVAHDRYVIPSDFIKNLEEFGGDYSVLVCRQTRLDGRRMPDWVTLGGEWSMTSPATLEYGDWSRHVFINGGIMVAKREVLKMFPWNELLFWGQAEDVELTRRLRAGGYLPRLARNVEVVSATMRSGLMDGYEAMPVITDKHMLPGPGNPNSELITPIVGYNRTINFGTAWEQAAARMGVYIDSSWVLDHNSMSLQGSTYGEITFKLPKKPVKSTLILIKVADSINIPEILVNDIEVNVINYSVNELLLEIPLEAHKQNNITRMHIRDKDSKFKIQSLIVQPPAVTSSDAPEEKKSFNTNGSGVSLLGIGWSQPEDWGCWLNGDHADLVLLPHSLNSNVVIEGYAKGFVRPPADETIIGVLINGIAMSHFTLKASFEDQRFLIKVPKEIFEKTKELRITFTPQDPCSPAEIGMNQDARLLSMGLVSLKILKH